MVIKCSCGHSFDAVVDVASPEVVVRCPACGQELRVRNRKAAVAAMSPSDVWPKRKRCGCLMPYGS